MARKRRVCEAGQAIGEGAGSPGNDRGQDVGLISSRLLAAGLAALLATSCASQPDVARNAPAMAPLDAEEQRFVGDFDAFLTQALARLGSVPGVSVAIARSDGPIFVRGYGMADIERAVPMTPD